MKHSATGHVSDMRRRIMDAALDLIAEKGMDCVSVREIVARVRVTKPVLYYYFKSKDDLCEQLGRQSVEDLRALIRSAQENKQPVDALLERLFLDMYDKNKRRPSFAKLILRAMSFQGNSRQSADVLATRKQHINAIAAAFRGAEKRGEIPRGAARDLAFLCGAVFGYFLISSSLGEIPYVDRDMPRRLAKIILAGVRKK
ncbi:MAG: TetR/AcrR family transcriptional regulator [Elusimicrobiales bacterium]